MRITKSQILDNLKWLTTIFLLSSFQLFDTYEWGKYSFLICSIIIFALSVIKNNWVARFHFEPFIAFLFLFTATVAVTAFWSMDYTGTLMMARTLLRISVCFTLVYWAYLYDENPYDLIHIIVFSSYIVAIYTVFVYGFGNIIKATDDVRLESSYSNINSIALFLSLGLICDLYMALFRKFRIHSLLSVLSFVVIVATQSRKAIVFVAVGVLALFLYRYSTSKNAAYRIFKFVFLLVCLFILFYFLAKLPLFYRVGLRLDLMINTFLGEGRMDRSSLMRTDLISLGFFCWRQRPLIGLGMASTHVVASKYLYFDSYLHNNYVELLAGGGLMCFTVYYSMYIYLAVKFFKLKANHYQWYVLGIILIGLILIIDYGKVSYYSKTNLFELMVLFLLISRFRRSDNVNRRVMEDAPQAL